MHTCHPVNEYTSASLTPYVDGCTEDEGSCEIAQVIAGRRSCRKVIDNPDTQRCELCGKPFEPSSNRQRFCCESHREEQERRESERRFRSRVIVCAVCGKAFHPKSRFASNAKYCSDRCRLVGKRKASRQDG